MSMLLGSSGGSSGISPLAGIMLFLGPAIGPTVGGALLGASDWRSIFLINVPFGVLAAVAVRRVPARLAPGPALGPRLLVRFTVRTTVLAGFAVLAAASLGLLAIGTATPLWLIAVILACRSAATGLVINPLLQALTRQLRPDQLGDASTVFNAWQRVAGSFGIGLIAALYSTALALPAVRTPAVG